MDYAPKNLNIAKLKRKIDISGLTVQVDAENVLENGRFYILWRNGNFIVIQAEPWCRPRPGFDPYDTLPVGYFQEEERALWHLLEVIQTMLDSIVIDGENNWAYLVRLRDGSYRLVYKNRQLVPRCSIWTKVVELDDIELTRFVNGLCWEGIYNGKDVDILIAWQDYWGPYVSAESSGQKLVQSRGVGHYFFDLKAHVSKNGVIVGIMTEAIVGRRITSADRFAVYEAVADIQGHGVLFFFEECQILITGQGVRFASASSAKYYQDRDALAKDAEPVWRMLEKIFHDVGSPLRRWMANPRETDAGAVIIPRLAPPARPITSTAEQIKMRWVWSIMMADSDITSRQIQRRSAITRGGKRVNNDGRVFFPPDEVSDLEISDARIGSADGPLPVVATRSSPTRHHPYARFSKRLPLP